MDIDLHIIILLRQRMEEKEEEEEDDDDSMYFEEQVCNLWKDNKRFIINKRYYNV